MGELSGRPSDLSVVLNRVALHARRIEFVHPITKDRMEISAELEPRLQSFVDLLDQTAKTEGLQ